jgi:dTDP-4-dehydrorhamnose 3,5-epimerase
VRLAGGTGDAFWVPPGFAHGFVTLTPETEVAYKVTDLYAPDCDRGLAWDDPDLALPWPDFAALGLAGGPVLSEKDRRHPRLRDLPPLFD